MCGWVGYQNNRNNHLKSSDINEHKDTQGSVAAACAQDTIPPLNLYIVVWCYNKIESLAYDSFN